MSTEREGALVAQGWVNNRGGRGAGAWLRRVGWVAGIGTVLLIGLGVFSWWWTTVVRLPHTVVVRNWTVEIVAKGQVVVLDRPKEEADAADWWYLYQECDYMRGVVELVSFTDWFAPHRPPMQQPVGPPPPPPQLSWIDCARRAPVYIGTSGHHPSIMVPLWAPAALGATAVVIPWFAAARRNRRVGLGLCVGCGYSLAGLGAGSVCPECGRGTV